MKRTYIAVALTSITALTAPAFAGALEVPVVQSAPAAPVVQETACGTRTVACGGAQQGYGDVSAAGALDGVDGKENIQGVHIGYNYDYGTRVSGTEFDQDDAGIDIGGGATTVDDVTRLKLKAGKDTGNWCPVLLPVPPMRIPLSEVTQALFMVRACRIRRRSAGSQEPGCCAITSAILAGRPALMRMPVPSRIAHRCASEHSLVSETDLASLCRGAVL